MQNTSESAAYLVPFWFAIRFSLEIDAFEEEPKIHDTFDRRVIGRFERVFQ